MMSGLIWQLPLFMAVAAIIDLLLVLVYMNWLHPWRGILEDVSVSLSFNVNIVLQRDLEFGHLSHEVPIQSEDQDNMLPKSLPNKVFIHWYFKSSTFQHHLFFLIGRRRCQFR